MKKAFAYPYIVWMAIFTALPLILMMYYAFTTDVNGEITFTLSNFARSLDPMFLKVMLQSILIAVITTIICFVIGYPVAYILAHKEFSDKKILVFLFIMPMWMNTLLLTYSWLTILDKHGVLNTLLTSIGLQPVNIIYTNVAVLIGMVYNFLPFMIFPIYTSIKKIDMRIIESASDLGADSKTILRKVIFPISLPGVVSGITMVFMPSVTTFVIPEFLGGGKYTLIGNLIEKQFILTNDWHFGAALSIILMVIIIISMALLSLIDRSKVKEGEF